MYLGSLIILRTALLDVGSSDDSPNSPNKRLLVAHWHSERLSQCPASSRCRPIILRARTNLKIVVSGYCHTGRRLTHLSHLKHPLMTSDLQSFWVFVND
jgi:hypothetical protein